MSSYGYTYEDLVEPRFSEIAMWIRDGMSEREIAKNLGVSYASFRNYKKQHLALLALLKKSVVSNPIAKVEEALITSASGQEYKEITRELRYNKKTEDWEMVVTKENIKVMPPNANAQKLFLNAWKPDRYKNKQTIEHEGELGVKKLENYIEEK
ncbi:MAG: hypothetical protein ABFD25_17160 [Clostridiaceae bacterium]